jgi:hypothetical protein
VPAEDKVLEVQADTPYYYAHHGRPLTDDVSLIPSTNCGHECTATRTATGLVRAGTQWTKRLRQIIENRLNERNFRTHQYELGRAQANSYLEMRSAVRVRSSAHYFYLDLQGQHSGKERGRANLRPNSLLAA